MGPRDLWPSCRCRAALLSDKHLAAALFSAVGGGWSQLLRRRMAAEALCTLRWLLVTQWAWKRSAQGGTIVHHLSSWLVQRSRRFIGWRKYKWAKEGGCGGQSGFRLIFFFFVLSNPSLLLSVLSLFYFQPKWIWLKSVCVRRGNIVDFTTRP